MKHARKDYDRIQDPAGLIPDDEPVFLLRAQDVLAPDIVLAWANEAERIGADPDLVLKARAQVKAMRDWQYLRTCKRPDGPPPARTTAREEGHVTASLDRSTADPATSRPIEVRYVRYDGASEDDLDEIVATNATVHLERMDNSTFMLTVHTENPGADLALWLGPKRAKCQAGLVCAAGNVLQKRPAAVPTDPQPAQGEG
ncbi:hypothetical protein [Luteitalea sp.]